jgi:hypothetical protein
MWSSYHLRLHAVDKTSLNNAINNIHPEKTWQFVHLLSISKMVGEFYTVAGEGCLQVTTIQIPSQQK